MEFNFKLPHYAKQMRRYGAQRTQRHHCLHRCCATSSDSRRICISISNGRCTISALIFCHILRHRASCPTVTKPNFKQESCVFIALSVQQQCWGFEQIPFKARSKGIVSQHSHSVCKTESVGTYQQLQDVFLFVFDHVCYTIMLLFEHWCFC